MLQSEILVSSRDLTSRVHLALSQCQQNHVSLTICAPYNMVACPPLTDNAVPVYDMYADISGHGLDDETLELYTTATYVKLFTLAQYNPLDLLVRTKISA